jgi:hypothetical protein
MLSTRDKSFLKFVSEALSKSILFVGRGIFIPWLNLSKLYSAFLNLHFKDTGITKKLQNIKGKI